MQLLFITVVLRNATAQHNQNALTSSQDNPTDFANDSFMNVNPDDVKVVYVVGVVMALLNCVGVCYVIYRTFKRWMKGNRSLSMAIRLPFYIACSGECDWHLD